MPKREEGEFTAPFLLLCEGPEDVCFFSSLLKARPLIPEFHIRHTGTSRWDTGGNSKFGDRLEALRTNRSFREIVKRVLIITDSDANPAASFANVQGQLQQAGFPVPNAVRQTAQGDPAVCVATVPFDQRGNLECLLAPVARQDAAINACVDQFVAGVTALKDWQPEQECKLRLRATMSARWQADPGINIAPLFLHQHARKIIPAEDQSLNPLANFIAQFAH